MKGLRILSLLLSAALLISLTACQRNTAAPKENTSVPETSVTAETNMTSAMEASAAITQSSLPTVEKISLDASWEYASFSVIHTDTATLYRSTAPRRNGKVICINAGHGCQGGSSKKTLCHPDGSPKVTGGSTGKGVVKATSINEGTTFLDGTSEADANLALALTVKALLLKNGFDVLMTRENENTQLDNIARTVIANQNADCHISLHYDSSTNDKGLFFIGVPSNKAYRDMEPVKSHYEAHIRLGEALLEGEKKAGVNIFSDGRMDLDLTQTSYSTIPSVDLEVGDRASDHSAQQHEKIAQGILNGLRLYYQLP